ncbi:hypothetical protein ILUMI_14114, partial [Ignelater luminosus]
MEGLLVEVANCTQAKKICQMQTFGGQPITVVSHERLNYTKGIISHRDLLNCSVDEITEALSECGVVEAKRMITKRNEVSVNTALVLLTFNRIKLPGRVKVSFYSLNVRPYITAPLRCYRCQSFGHISANYLEKEIKTIQTLQKIPYAEARKQVVPKGGLSYSQVAAKPSQTSNIVPAVQALVPQITAAVVKEIKSLLQLQSSVPRTTPSINQRNINLDISDSISVPPPVIPTAKSVAFNQSASEINILRAEASNTDTALAMESDSAKDKRKRNESVSTDPASAREDDISVIDSSAESNEEL